MRQLLGPPQGEPWGMNRFSLTAGRGPPGFGVRGCQTARRNPQVATNLTWAPIAGPEGPAIGKQKLSPMPPPPPVLGSVTPCPRIRLRRVFCLCFSFCAFQVHSACVLQMNSACVLQIGAFEVHSACLP